ncbi:hypothetical protein PanWU01x14_362900 [Parasponia andersonii]|uniref:Uncharacterized protein n=1 Tax=Parasponia andersonii TaxID=3476 RepID=A0A2P5A6V2_PARAD|nr:hypothetical protein PanWU01x14_362900 [Parasponia andersonii]
MFRLKWWFFFTSPLLRRLRARRSRRLRARRSRRLRARRSRRLADQEAPCHPVNWAGQEVVGHEVVQEEDVFQEAPFHPLNGEVVLGQEVGLDVVQVDVDPFGQEDGILQVGHDIGQQQEDGILEVGHDVGQQQEDGPLEDQPVPEYIDAPTVPYDFYGIISPSDTRGGVLELPAQFTLVLNHYIQGRFLPVFSGGRVHLQNGIFEVDDARFHNAFIIRRMSYINGYERSSISTRSWGEVLENRDILAGDHLRFRLIKASPPSLPFGVVHLTLFREVEGGDEGLVQRIW